MIQTQNRWLSCRSKSKPSIFLSPKKRLSSPMTLPPTVNDPESQQLNGPASTTAIKKCVDFISDLPWDIVSAHIMPRILGEGPRSPAHRLERSCGYMDVSSTWAKRIISAYKGNYFVLDADHTLSDKCCTRIRMLAPYMESLSLRNLGAQYIPQFLKCHMLETLTRLRIQGNHHRYSM